MDQDWATSIRDNCFLLIAQHTHQGSGAGSKLTGYLSLDLTEALLTNNTYLMARNAAGTGTINILKIDASDNLVIDATGISGTAIKDEDTLSSDSATHLATQQSIKAYVDNAITVTYDLDIAADSGTDAIVDTETLTFTGGTGIDTTASSGTNAVTFAVDSTVATLTGSQTLTNKTIDSDSNTITNIVNADIKAAAAIAYSKLNLTGAVLSADLAGSIDATKLADGTVTDAEFQYIGGLTSDAQNQIDAKQATMSGTSNEIDVASNQIGISNNPVVPGTDAMVVPKGTTAQQSSTTAGAFRYNTSTSTFEGYTTAWGAIGGAGGAGSESIIKLYKADADDTTDFTIKSIDDILPDFDGSDTLTATFEKPTSGGDALLTNDDADHVYRLATTTASQYDAVGFSLGMPSYQRGRDALLQFEYRTEDASGSSVNGDYMVYIVDDTNMVNTTTTSTGAQSAGTSLTVGTSTGMSVGDKIMIGETGGTDQLTEAHITAIADSTHVTISEDVNLTSGDRFVTGILTDSLTTLDASDSDTNKIGSTFKVNVLIPETCAQIKVMFQQLTSQTDSELFFDNVLISSDPFKKISTQKMPYSVVARGNGSGSMTANVTDIDFTEETDADSLWSGSVFTAPETVDVQVSGHVKYSAVGSQYIYAFIDGTRVDLASGAASMDVDDLDYTVRLNKDQTLSFRLDQTKTLSNSTTEHWIRIIATPLANQSVIVESIEDEKENQYSAYIDGTGTPAVTTTSSEWISSITDNSTGDYTINFVSGIFTVAPVLVGTVDAGSDKHVNFDTITTSSANVRVNTSSTGGAVDDQFWVVAMKQGADYTSPSDKLKPLLAFPTITVGQEPEEVQGTTNFSSASIDTTNLLGSYSAGTFTATTRCKVTATVDGTSPTIDTVSRTSKTIILNSADTLVLGGTPTSYSIVIEPIFGQTNQAAIISQPVAFIKDVKSSGTSAGTFTSGAWQTRTLSNLSGDIADVGVTLSSNQFTLSSGKYLIEAIAPCYATDQSKAKIRNVTDSSDTLIGLTNIASSTGSASADCVISGVVTITSSKTFEIQHRCATTKASNGFGIASTFSVDEIYTQVKVTRLK